VIGSPSPDLERAREKWSKLQPNLDDVLETSELAEDPTLVHTMQCLRVEMDQVSASLTCCDVVGVHNHMLSAMVCCQALQWGRTQMRR
jgi:hypothetical protein